MKTSAANYLPLNGRLKVLEEELPTESDLERVIDSPDMEHVKRVLADLPISKYVDDITTVRSAADLEPAFQSRLDDSFKVIAESAPDEALVQLLRARFEWHNVKVVAKAILGGSSLKKAPLSASATWNIDELKQVLEGDEDGVALPERVIGVMRSMREVGKQQPMAIDLLADAELAKDWNELSKHATRDVRSFIQFMLDLQNLKVAVRLMKMDANKERAQQALVDAPRIEVESLLMLFGEGMEQEDQHERLLELFMKAEMQDEKLRAALEDALQNNNVSGLEKVCDDALITRVREGRGEMFGALPALGFFLGTERALTNLRIALVGKQYDMPREKVVERIRMAY